MQLSCATCRNDAFHSNRYNACSYRLDQICVQHVKPYQSTLFGHRFDCWFQSNNSFLRSCIQKKDGTQWPFETLWMHAPNSTLPLNKPIYAVYTVLHWKWLLLCVTSLSIVVVSACVSRHSWEPRVDMERWGTWESLQHCSTDERRVCIAWHLLDAGFILISQCCSHCGFPHV